MPQPPCGSAVQVSSYPAAGQPGTAPAVAKTWQAEQIRGWTPPACTGWASGAGRHARTVVALAGRFRVGGGGEQLLRRLGAITTLEGVRYWSTSDGAWRPLVSGAWTLDGPDPARRRADLTAAEFARRREVYFAQRDSRPSGDVVYRTRLLEYGPDRIVIATENVTPIRLVIVTLFQPGALQTVQILQRLPDSNWGYYGLTRTLDVGTSAFASGHSASYVNRASALFHFAAGSPSERDPPLAR